MDVSYIILGSQPQANGEKLAGETYSDYYTVYPITKTEL